MRIGVLTQKFGQVGGVSTVAHWLVDGLRASGNEVEVMELAESRTDQYSRRIGRPRTFLRSTLRGGVDTFGQTHWGANAVEVELMRYLPRRELTAHLNKFDVVQVVCGGPALGYVTRDVSRPVIIQAATRVEWERASILSSYDGVNRHVRRAMTRAVSRLEPLALRGASVALLENWEMLRFAQSVGQHRSYFAPPGTDTNRFVPARTRASDGFLLSVCRLGEPRKGLENLIEGYARLLRSRPSAPDLILAGRGELYENAAVALHDSPVRDRIHVQSDVPLEELPDLYRKASVFVQGSWEEGLGLSSIEAMASGLPVCATATDGSRAAVVDRETGHLVELDGDRELLWCNIARAMEKCLDDGDALGAAGRQRAESVFSTDACLQSFLGHYEASLQTFGEAR